MAAPSSSASFFWRLLLLPLLLASSASASHVLFRSQLISSSSSAYPPTPQPYRTAFHFQPPKNWMNDPNGLMFYQGNYHLFYQWNPYAAVWGNITWGHAVSTDLIHWRILDLALVPDQWYDKYGCWSGSATFLADGRPVLVYTGWSNASAAIDDQVQMQAMAVPADPSDTLLRRWKKVKQNPILQAPSGINSTKFRDPTTAWRGSDGRWRMLVGARRKHRGVALLYRSSDFVHWDIAKHPLHTVPFTGMWECPDFYPVPVNGSHGLDPSAANGPGVMHVLKVSLDDKKHDYYSVGKYMESTDAFVPANAALDTGIGLRYDYGKFYASKSFYDSQKHRRILFGWVNESSTMESDVAKGWSSVQGFPRMVWLDEETKQNLVQWPVPESEKLRTSQHASIQNVSLAGGSVVELDGASGAQLDIEVEFEIPEILYNRKQVAMNGVADAGDDKGQLTCSDVGTSMKSAGLLGPFGLLVLASDDRLEQTAVFFYVQSAGASGSWRALVCSDQSRSSLAQGPDKTSYGSYVSISRKQSSFRLRVLVDHSIVETFAQGGKLCITSRVYPTKAIDGDAHLYVFNNGTTPIRVKRLTAWEMSTVRIDESL